MLCKQHIVVENITSIPLHIQVHLSKKLLNRKKSERDLGHWWKWMKSIIIQNKYIWVAAVATAIQEKTTPVRSYS